jgi:5-methylcytosine-specific restriction endonuclease McrA
MNNLFRNQFINNVNTKINTLKDIFIAPHKIYSNAKYNKKNKNDINKKKYIPKKIKIDTNNFKYKKKNNLINTNLLKDIEKDIHKSPHTYKEPIPKRIRELVWTTNNGETFSHKCYVTWCDNTINVFNFQVGHDIPESKGGTIDIDNLKPICTSCNLSMSNKYTITEWSKLIDINHSEDNKDHETINDDNNNNVNNKKNKNNSNNSSNKKPTTLITKIKNILPTLPTITLLGFVFKSFRYLKV